MQRGGSVWRRRKFDWIATRLGIEKQEDWYSVSTVQLKANGERVSSVKSTLESVYPEFIWDAQRFKRIPHAHWKDVLHRREYMDWLADELNIQRQEDWYTVSKQELEPYLSHSPLTLYNGSLFKTLSATYQEFQWNESIHLIQQKLKRSNKVHLLPFVHSHQLTIVIFCSN